MLALLRSRPELAKTARKPRVPSSTDAQRFFENLILGANHPLVESDLNLHGHRLDSKTPYRG